MTLPVPLTQLFSASTWVLAAGWWWHAIDWIFHSEKIKALTLSLFHAADPAPSDPKLDQSGEGRFQPDLTVIVPACNEEASIEATLRSILASTQIRLQIIAVDDRSTDRTGEIMQTIASEASAVQTTSSAFAATSLELLSIKDLPKGWLGKPHALATAAQLARADWLLFTDGDVLFSPEALALALRFAKREQADHLVLMPDWIIKTRGEAAMYGAIHALTTWSFRPWQVADPEKREFIGVGAFNLIRRTTYDELGGFAALRMEVVEDLRLGWLVKRAGYRQRVAAGHGLVSVRWSIGAIGVVRNLEKNLFALYRFNTPLALFACLGLLVQVVLPPVALWMGGWARVAALLLYAAIGVIYLVSRRLTRIPAGYVVTYPLAVGVFLWANLRSIGLALLRGGVIWRGTLYPLKDLRAHTGKFW